MKITKQTLINAIILSFSVIFIDYIFHLTATSPQENLFYFLIKFIIVFILGLIMLSLKKLSAIKVLIFTIAFIIIFSLYYRINEFIYSAQFGSRVPDIFSIGYYSHPFISIFLWGLVHGLAFAIPSIILRRFKK